MKKQQKQLILLLLALLFLVGGYFGLKYYNENAVEEAPVEEVEYVVEIPKDSVQRISYLYEDQEYSFVKEGEDWVYEADPAVQLDSYYLDLMQDRCEGMKAVEKIEKVTDMSQYGLAEPDRYFSFETDDAAYTFYIGDRNTVSMGCYICEPEGDTIYMVDHLVSTSFSKTLEDLIEEEEEESEDAEAAD